MTCFSKYNIWPKHLTLLTTVSLKFFCFHCHNPSWFSSYPVHSFSGCTFLHSIFKNVFSSTLSNLGPLLSFNVYTSFCGYLHTHSFSSMYSRFTYTYLTTGRTIIISHMIALKCQKFLLSSTTIITLVQVLIISLLPSKKLTSSLVLPPTNWTLLLK